MLSTVLHFCSGNLLQNLSGVDSAIMAGLMQMSAGPTAASIGKLARHKLGQKMTDLGVVDAALGGPRVPQAMLKEFGRDLVMDGAGGNQVLLSPQQALFGERMGHIPKGAWGSSDALKQAQAAARKLPPLDSSERAPFVQDVWSRTGWDIGERRTGHPLTEADSSGVKLTPFALEANTQAGGVPITVHKNIILQDLLTGLERGTLVGGVAPSLRLSAVPSYRVTHVAGQRDRVDAETALRGNSIAVHDSTPETILETLRHEALGHGMQKAWRGPDEIGPFLRGSEVSRANQGYATYWRAPWEELARLVEPSDGVNSKVPPSQRDAYINAPRDVRPPR